MNGADRATGRRPRTPSARVAPELLNAAESVLVKDGMRGLTVRAVAAEAGVAPMSVYNQFGGKAGLLATLLLRGFGRLEAAMEACEEDDARTQLHHCCLKYREFALANPQLYAVLFQGTTLSERESARVRKHADGCLRLLARNVKLAAAAGAIAERDAHEAAQQIWGALHGAVALELKGLAQTLDSGVTYRALVETILRGLARQPQ
ncbi:MAG TPA: TetR/AcrR family transcriptional regulator [Trebonia sp.]|jgi:AcrR family transcriptional regulator|nr:TetR/AcrR family transcriptional regulator [Trebonia sp.]